MKIEKFREMTQADLQHKVIELRDTLFKTKIKVQTKQVENTAQLGILRRDLARVLTLLREMEVKGISTPLAAAAQQVEAPAVKPAKAKPVTAEPAKAAAKPAEKKIKPANEKKAAKAAHKK
jgi:large subunit ribosomal protein L29